MNEYLVIFFQEDKIRVRCDNNYLRQKIMNQLDGMLKSCLPPKSSWENAHFMAEGGFFKSLLTKGNVDKSTMKRKLDKKKNTFSSKDFESMKIEGMKWYESRQIGSRSTITFKSDCNLFGF